MLAVQITGLGSRDGTVNLAVFSTASGFPDQSHSAVYWRAVSLAGKEAEILIEDLAYGAYAIAVLHDENRNGRER
jgi:uncharacterized protein (DUF2141 family)